MRLLSISIFFANFGVDTDVSPAEIILYESTVLSASVRVHTSFRSNAPASDDCCFGLAVFEFYIVRLSAKGVSQIDITHVDCSSVAGFGDCCEIVFNTCAGIFLRTNICCCSNHSYYDSC